MTGPADLNSPLFSGPWCDSAGNLTALARIFVMRMWQRTGYAPGVDGSWASAQGDVGALLAALSSAVSSQARADAEAAIAEAKGLLLEASALRAQAIFSINEARDEARIAYLEAQSIRAEARRALDDAKLSLMAILDVQSVRAEMRKAVSDGATAQQEASDAATMAILNAAHGSDFF